MLIQASAQTIWGHYTAQSTVEIFFGACGIWVWQPLRDGENCAVHVVIPPERGQLLFTDTTAPGNGSHSCMSSFDDPHHSETVSRWKQKATRLEERRRGL